MSKQNQIQVAKNDHGSEIHRPGKEMNDHTCQSGKENPMVVMLIKKTADQFARMVVNVIKRVNQGLIISIRHIDCILPNVNTKRK